MSARSERMRHALRSIRAGLHVITKRKQHLPSSVGLPSPIPVEKTLALAPVGSGTDWVVCESGLRHSTPIKDELCSFIGWIDSEVPEVEVVPRVWRPVPKPWAKPCYMAGKTAGDWVPAGVKRVLHKVRRLTRKPKRTINKAGGTSKKLGASDRSPILVATPSKPKAEKRNRRLVRKCLFPDEDEMFLSCEGA